MWLANTNAVVWAIGNGLVSTQLVTYLALDLGAEGKEISWILAAPHIAGLLRLVTPAMMDTGMHRKVLCIVGYLISTVVLVAMPLLAVPWEGRSPATGLTLLVACWCVYHLFEYIATVGLWSWLGDWMPGPVRGRLIGWRERFLIGGRILGIGSSLLLSWYWNWLDPDAPRWLPLFWSAIVGAGAMVLAVVPLFWLGAKSSPVPSKHVDLWSNIVRVFVDRPYRRLLTYSCGFAAANGITSAAQSIYPWHVLGIHYEYMVGMRSMMYAGQTAIAPACGWWIDRFGATRLLVTCQLIIATGPLFFLFATPDQWWWIVGAYVVWIAYAPLNVGLDSLKLKLVPTQFSGPSLAVYHAFSDLSYAAATLVAGSYYDQLKNGGAKVGWLFATFFVVGAVLRSSAALLASRIPDNRAS